MLNVYFACLPPVLPSGLKVGLVFYPEILFNEKSGRCVKIPSPFMSTKNVACPCQAHQCCQLTAKYGLVS
jgi:hypothetical protein